MAVRRCAVYRLTARMACHRPYFGAMHAQLEEQPAKSSVGECLKGFEGAALTALTIVENMGKALGKPDVEFAFARGFGSFASGMVLAAMGEPCDAPAVTTRGGGGEHEHGEESGDAEGGSTDTRSWLEEAKRKAHEQSHVEPRESLSGAPSKAEPEPLHHTEQAHANVKLWLRALTDVQDKRQSDWLHSAKHDAYELAMALFQHSTAPSSQSKSEFCALSFVRPRVIADIGVLTQLCDALLFVQWVECWRRNRPSGARGRRRRRRRRKEGREKIYMESPGMTGTKARRTRVKSPQIKSPPSPTGAISAPRACTTWQNTPRLGVRH